jgi:hypothetical protein
LEEGIFGDEDEQAELTPEMQRELATVLAMVITGGADHRVVEMRGPDGRTGFAVVAACAADDPEKLREIREGLHRWAAERKPSTRTGTVSPAPARRTKPTEGLSPAPAHDALPPWGQEPFGQCRKKPPSR